MVWLLYLFYLLLSSSAKSQREPVELLPLHDPTFALQPLPTNGHPVAVQVQTRNLRNVSNSVLVAETWLRNYVLPFYPSTNVTTIIVGHALLCSGDRRHELGFVLPAVKNIHYSLTRWGLQNDIKATTSFSSDCLKNSTYRFDFAEDFIKPLLGVLQEIGSPYVVNPPETNFHTLSEERFSFLEPHHKSMKNLGVFPRLRKANVVVFSPRNEKPTSRKLSSIDISQNIVPFPAHAAKSPLPPLIGTIPPAPEPEPNSRSPPFSPHLAPAASPPYGPHLPPCEPSGGALPPGVGGAHRGLWCVAKPSVPPETLQEAMDYACGEGGADCGAIGEDGSCYYPDTVVAHASYAFNSYWQKNKRSGGTCGFGGTAMLINSDPSYSHCRFMLT